jgi:hypothetical protein
LQWSTVATKFYLDLGLNACITYLNKLTAGGLSWYRWGWIISFPVEEICILGNDGRVIGIFSSFPQVRRLPFISDTVRILGNDGRTGGGGPIKMLFRR